MSIEPRAEWMSEESFRDWRPPEGGITASNLYSLPGLPLPEHTQLIDGGLFFPIPEPAFHGLMTRFLADELTSRRPAGLQVAPRVPLTLAIATRVEPDLLVLADDARTLADGSRSVETAQLVVEVVTDESDIRDRELKPVLYARAGIPHFWRVEEEDGKPVVYVYEILPATSQYFLIGAYNDRLRRTVPFDVDIDLKLALVDRDLTEEVLSRER